MPLVSAAALAKKKAYMRLYSRRKYEESHPGCPPYIPGARGPRRLPDDVRAQRRAELQARYAAERYEASLRRQRAHWLFLANQIPGCLTPLKCKACKKYFRPEDFRKSSKRCKPCAREKVRNARKRMKAEDPARFKAARKRSKHRRRALLKGNGGSYTQAEWQSVLKAWDYRCARCGKGGEMTVDHVHPVSLGGKNIASNLQPMCHLCNSLKGNVVTGATQTLLTGILTFAHC
jgi:5-methylcytosine-specific restriction endonuclease McrA